MKGIGTSLTPGSDNCPDCKVVNEYLLRFSPVYQQQRWQGTSFGKETMMVEKLLCYLSLLKNYATVQEFTS